MSSDSNDKWIGSNFAGTSGLIPKTYTIVIKDTQYTDANTFKQAMQGVMLYYELAEPIETITEIDSGLSAKCEAGGTITFEGNENYNLPIPNSVEYAVALKEVARYE